MRTGIDLISSERKRQIESEGYTPEHDDAHDKGELADAACTLAMSDRIFEELESRFASRLHLLQFMWPFEIESYKATDERIESLAKAGALIAAEIDRLQRMRIPPTQSYYFQFVDWKKCFEKWDELISKHDPTFFQLVVCEDRYAEGYWIEPCGKDTGNSRVYFDDGIDTVSDFKSRLIEEFESAKIENRPVNFIQ